MHSWTVVTCVKAGWKNYIMSAIYCYKIELDNPLALSSCFFRTNRNVKIWLI